MGPSLPFERNREPRRLHIICESCYRNLDDCEVTPVQSEHICKAASPSDLQQDLQRLEGVALRVLGQLDRRDPLWRHLSRVCLSLIRG